MGFVLSSQVVPAGAADPAVPIARTLAEPVYGIFTGAVPRHLTCPNGQVNHWNARCPIVARRAPEPGRAGDGKGALG
ncbi:hypothetical protein GCM10009546_41030 [Actinomadura livida]|uniref:Uncharacterized protein n=1 Tax=Actinomadura livida TaxID=79909 RepID=A0ABN1ETM9_9ACTN|nr:hypothetical protein GCM10010208_70730 [Actinomadura livida]